ncbi:MAG: beta-N-acetylhexosaminidase [Bacilli bacterium]
MKRKITILIAIFISILIITGCLNRKIDFESLSIEEKVNYHIKNMSLEEKIAQMLIVYYNSDSFDNNLKGTLESVKPGGFILQGINITNYEDTLNYVKQIKETSQIPMFISIDQEGGLVQRLYNLKDIKPTYIPSMYDVGKLNDKDVAYQVGEVMAKELRTIGVNLTFAPVIDIYTNEENTVIGSRAFGTTKEVVINNAIPLANGLFDNGVIPVFKHFPGHGDTHVDSHVGLPIVNKTLNQLKELELLPFKEAIQNNAKMIMVGHIAYPNITGDYTPATLSNKMINEVLRKELNFNGVVITDALNMGALTENYTDVEIYEKAINAGVDILLMPNGSTKAISLIKESISNGKITEDRINQSLRRILTLKYEQLNDDNYLSKDYLGKQEHKDIIDKISINNKLPITDISGINN